MKVCAKLFAKRQPNNAAERAAKVAEDKIKENAKMSREVDELPCTSAVAAKLLEEAKASKMKALAHFDKSVNTAFNGRSKRVPHNSRLAAAIATRQAHLESLQLEDADGPIKLQYDDAFDIAIDEWEQAMRRQRRSRRRSHVGIRSRSRKGSVHGKMIRVRRAGIHKRKRPRSRARSRSRARPRARKSQMRRVGRSRIRRARSSHRRRRVTHAVRRFKAPRTRRRTYRRRR